MLEAQTQFQASALPRGFFLPGGFWRRFVAFIIDVQVVSLLLFPVNFAVGIFVNIAMIRNGGFSGAMSSLILGYVFQMSTLFVCYMWYFIYFYQRRAATPGKLIMRLRVVDSTSGVNLTVGGIVKREFLGRILCAFSLMLGYLLAAVRSDKRALHDLVGGSRVLYHSR